MWWLQLGGPVPWLPITVHVSHCLSLTDTLYDPLHIDMDDDMRLARADSPA
jgi:hypothetical protein